MKINKETSYLIGLAQTDGHLQQSSQGRGKFTIELADKDADIIHKIASLIPYNYSIFKRKRKTNFSLNFSGIGIRVCNEDFRKWLNESGVPYGSKSLIVAPPLHLPDLSIDNYVRGLWDGDGSVGYTSNRIPYLSFTTNSIHLRDFIEDYIAKILGHHNNHFTKPKRDNVFNIMVTKEAAIKLAGQIYPAVAKSMSIHRKFANAQEVRKWERPADMKKVTWEKKKWNKEEDAYLLKNGVEKTMQKSNRNLKSVQIRLWRLTGHC